MKNLFSLFVLSLAAAGAFAQSAPAASSPSKSSAKQQVVQGLPAGVSSETTAYLLSPELTSQIRDAQLEWDELEIDTQKMQVKIEQNKERQKELTDSIRLAAYQFAQEKQIDLKVWELDPKELKFLKKDAKAKK